MLKSLSAWNINKVIEFTCYLLIYSEYFEIKQFLPVIFFLFVLEYLSINTEFVRKILTDEGLLKCR